MHIMKRYISIFYFWHAGDRQLQLTQALEQTPSASFMEALESFVAWMINAEQLLASETLVIGELELVEHQLSQYLVRLLLLPGQLLCVPW